MRIELSTTQRPSFLLLMVNQFYNRLMEKLQMLAMIDNVIAIVGKVINLTLVKAILHLQISSDKSSHFPVSAEKLRKFRTNSGQLRNNKASSVSMY